MPETQLNVAPPMVISMGDPAGVGMSTVIKAWQELKDQSELKFALLANAELVEAEAKQLGLEATISRITDIGDVSDHFHQSLPVIDIPLPKKPTPGEPSTENAQSIIEAIRIATQFCLEGTASAMITAPIAKEVLYGAGFEFPGHTEYIAYLCNEAHNQTRAPIMLLAGGGLKVALQTIHIPLKDAINSLSSDTIYMRLIDLNNALKLDYGLATPKIGVCGLNPHAGEGGKLGTEESEIITPAIEKARTTGAIISSPQSADTIFHRALEGEFDCVLAMYHDQGLIPVKTLAMWDGVNSTLGLPIIRTSPDHGTGFDAAKSGHIRHESMVAAIRHAHMRVQNRLKHSQ